MNAKKLKSNRCLICDSPLYILTDGQLIIDGLPVQYEVCEVCAFTRKVRRAFPSPEKEKREYDFHENTLENHNYVAMLERFLVQSVDPYKKHGSALDFGCGPGPVLAELLKRRGFHVQLYDPFYAPGLSVLNAQYDVVCATEVIEHFHHPIQSFETLINCLKDDGILALMTKARPKRDEDFLAWWYRRDATHVAFYTKTALAHIARRFRLKTLQAHRDDIAVFKLDEEEHAR